MEWKNENDFSEKDRKLVIKYRIEIKKYQKILNEIEILDLVKKINYSKQVKKFIAENSLKIHEIFKKYNDFKKLFIGENKNENE